MKKGFRAAEHCRRLRILKLLLGRPLVLEFHASPTIFTAQYVILDLFYDFPAIRYCPSSQFRQAATAFGPCAVVFAYCGGRNCCPLFAFFTSLPYGHAACVTYWYGNVILARAVTQVVRWRQMNDVPCSPRLLEGT